MEASKLVNSSNNKDFLLSVILYTDGKPYIKKCLQDKIYWDALNENSGGSWKIYAINPIQGISSSNNPPQGTFGLMIPIGREPSVNKGLIDFFDIKDIQKLPVIVLFDVKNDEINNSLMLKIDGRNQEEVYNDLDFIIRNIRLAINKNGCSLDKVERTVGKIKILKHLKGIKKSISEFNALIPSFF